MIITTIMITVSSIKHNTHSDKNNNSDNYEHNDNNNSNTNADINSSMILTTVILLYQ